MIRHVVYLIEQPLDQRSVSRFGIETLIDNEFEVSVFDCTPFRFPRPNAVTTNIETRRPFRTMVFTDESQALKAISRLEAGTFAIVLMGYGPETYPIYRALSMMEIPYGVSTMNARPAALRNRTVSKLKQVFADGSRRSLRALSGAGRNFIYRRKAAGLHGAALWFAAGSESPAQYFYPRDARTRILWMHSTDYDLYLAEKERPAEIADKAVFLDQYLPFHTDFYYEGRLNPVDPETYYARLRALFGMLELSTGLSTEVAGHPRAHVDDGYSRYFGNRPVIYSRTPNLVRRSKLVIAHYTTAVNLAVLFRKPVLFITTRQLQKSGQGVHIESAAKWLGKQVIDLDAPLERVDWDREMRIDEASYARYQRCFISTPEAPDVPSWQILADMLKQMN